MKLSDAELTEACELKFRIGLQFWRLQKGTKLVREY